MNKVNTKETFETSQSINDFINNKYNSDIDAIRNLAGITNYILTEETFKFPATNIYINNLSLKDASVRETFTLDGQINIINKDDSFLNIIPRYMIVAYGKDITITLSNGDNSYNVLNIPKGWAICDGRKYSIDMEEKITIVDYENGIITPDLRGKFIIGAGEGGRVNTINNKKPTTSTSTSNSATTSTTNTINIELSKRTLNETGGSEKVTLTKNEMPYHTHRWGPDHWDGNLANTEGTDTGGSGKIQNDASTYVNTFEIGNNQPHENMPPFYALIYIMKL
jgi:microcystin-dependent protein